MSDKENRPGLMNGDVVKRGGGGGGRDAAVKIGASGRSLSTGEPLGSKSRSIVRNGDVASASVASPSWRSEPQPLTYRGVRSLKHRHDKSYNDGLRKTTSLHDLPVSPGDVSDDTGQLDDSRGKSLSRESLASSSGSAQWVSSSNIRGLSKSCSDLTDANAAANKPKTFFEFLVNEPPPKPPTRSSRYMRLAGIPQTRPIDNYTPPVGQEPTRSQQDPSRSQQDSARSRHISGPTTDLECMEANRVVAVAAQFWEAKSHDSVNSLVAKRSKSIPRLNTDHTDVGVVRSSRSSSNVNASRPPSISHTQSVPSLPTTRGGNSSNRTGNIHSGIPSNKTGNGSHVVKSRIGSPKISRSGKHVTARSGSPLNTNSASQASPNTCHIANKSGKSPKLIRKSKTAPNRASASAVTKPFRYTASASGGPADNTSVSNTNIPPAEPPPTTTTTTPPAPPWRSSSHKHSRVAPTSAKTSIPARSSSHSNPAHLTGHHALSQDQPVAQDDGEESPGTARTRGAPRSLPRAASSPAESTFRSRSPTTSLLLNGRTKNETDERKMAKSDFTSTHVSEEANHMESPAATPDESHNTDLEYMKKGWLVKQGSSDKDWTKYWFVLSGATLKYYKDMEAEKTGDERGSVDLTACYDMLEVVVARKYGFKLRTRNGDHTLSALTLGIRKNWMQAIGQCVQTNGGAMSSSSSSQEGSPQTSRRANDRYHTHSGAFITRAQTREVTETPRESSPKTDKESTPTRKSERSGIPTRRTELPASEPPKYSVRQTSANEVTVTTPGGGMETVRMRSRRRTTENVTRMPELTTSSSSSPNASKRQSCTWPYEAESNNNMKRTSSSHSLKSQDSGSQRDLSGSQRDLSQYLEDNERPPELSRQEEEELDNVERNIRHIHRRSLNESVQLHRLKHLDKFESGAAFSAPADHQMSRERSRSRERSHSPSNQSSRDSSANRASPGRSKTPTRDILPSDSDSRSTGSGGHMAPSTKVKNKSKTRLSRARSPPPETHDDDDDYLDTFVKRNLDVGVASEPSNSSHVVEKTWKHVERTPERPPLPSSESVGDVLVDFWEAEVESLKSQLDRTQNQLTDVQKQNTELRIQLRRTNIEQADYVSDLEVYQSRYIPQIEDYHYLEQTSEMYKIKLTEAETHSQRAVKQIQELQDKLKDHEGLVQTQEEEMAILQSKLSVSMSELNKLEQSLMLSAQELHTEQDSSQKIIDDLEARIEQLEDDLETKVKQLHGRDQEAVLHVDKVRILEAALAERSDMIEHMETDLHNVTAVKHQLDEKTNLAAALRQEADILRQQLREQDEVLQRSQMDGMSKVKVIENEFYRDKEQLEMRLEQLQLHIEQVTKQSNMADSLNANMADILKEKDETIAQLEEKLIEFESRVEELSEELHLEVEENSKLHGDLDQAKKEEESLRHQISEMQHELGELEEEYNKLTEETRDLNRQLNEKNTEHQMLTQDLERVEGDLIKLKESHHQDKSEIGRSKSADYMKLKSRYAELCEDLDRANTEIMVFSERLDIEQREKEAIQSINHDALTEVDQVRSLYEVALRDLNEAQNRTTSFDERMREKDRQNHSGLQAKEQEVHDLRCELTQYKAGHEKISNKVKELEVMRRDLKEQLESQSCQYQDEIKTKHTELETSQRNLLDLQEKLRQTDGHLNEESQLLVHLSKSSNLNDSSLSSPRSETSSLGGDVPGSYEELKVVYRKLGVECRDQKREIRDISVRLEDADSVNVSLKQHLKNLETGYQGQVDQLGSKVQDLLTQLSNMERRNKRLERRTRSQEVSDQIDTETQTESPPTSHVPADLMADDQHVQEIQNELDISDAKVNQLMDRLMQQRNFEVELDLVHQQLESLEAENQKHRERLGSISSQDDVFRDSNPSGQLRELKLKVRGGAELLDRCSGKLSKVVTHLGGDIVAPAKTDLESVLTGLGDVRSLLPCGDAVATSGVSDDIKLRLFSERLALEAVVLGEMSYLVRSEQGEDDRGMCSADVYSARAKVAEITSLLYRQYCGEDADSIKEESLSVYASLLSEKFRIQTQLLLTMDKVQPLAGGNVDVFVSDDKRLQQVARTGLSQSALSMFLSSSLSSPIMSSCVSHASARTDLACALSKLNESAQNVQYSSQNMQESECSRVCRELMAESATLQERLAPAVDTHVRDIMWVLLQCDKCLREDSTPSLELFSEELRHVTKMYLTTSGAIDLTSEGLYTDSFFHHLNQTVDQHIHRLLEDIEQTCRDISTQDSNPETRTSAELEQERTRLLLQLGYVISQISVVQALATYFPTDKSDSESTSPSSLSSGAMVNHDDSALKSPSLLSGPQDKAKMATMLAREAASRNDLASFIVNNVSRGDSPERHLGHDQIVSLSSQLVDLDLKMLEQRHTGTDFAALVRREAVTQAQMSYLIQYLKLQHESAMDSLRVELESTKLGATFQQHDASDREEELEDMTFELENAHKQRAHVEEIAADLESELQRKENNFRQEVQALKDGYDIRIRSLQADVDVSKRDLEKLHQEKELDGHEFEESLHTSIIEYETRIERLVSEREAELAASRGRIRELEERIAKLMLERERQLSSSQEEERLGRCLSVTSEDTDATRGRLEEIDTLRHQLEEEKKRHISELERLQVVLHGDNNAAAQALLTTKIQQLEEQIQNMQHDYEQELSIQKSAHRRELARSKDDMMQLLATAEAKSMHIDEEAIRKKYMKEIDRIRVLYDRSFAAMEKSHQKLMMQMRKAHKRELDMLRQEKDQVLGEETKATQAALDAMRKAHDRELQKERNKFLDVIAKTYSLADVESLQKQHEADLDLIQGELQELSEQYSFRCLEKVSLEQRLWAQSSMVQRCRKHIQELMTSREEVISRNKHDIEKLKRQATSTGGATSDGQDVQMLLKVKDAEIHQLGDEIKMLKDQLQGTIEELEENLDKYHELNSIHNVTEQRHQRELEEVRREQSHMVIVDESDDSLSLDSPRDGEVDDEGSDLVTSTPLRITGSIPEDGDLKLSEVKPAGRPNGDKSSVHRTAKKSLWRQKQPQRARSTPGLTGEMTVTLQKQMSVDHIPANRKNPEVSDTSKVRVLRPSLSLDSTETVIDEKL